MDNRCSCTGVCQLLLLSNKLPVVRYPVEGRSDAGIFRVPRIKVVIHVESVKDSSQNIHVALSDVKGQRRRDLKMVLGVGNKHFDVFLVIKNTEF